MNYRKPSRAAAWGLAAVAALWLHLVDPSVPLAAPQPRFSAEPVTVVFPDQTAIHIPAHYFYDGAQPTTISTESVLLLATLPDLAPQDEGTWYKLHWGTDQKTYETRLTIVVSWRRPTDSIQHVVDWLLSSAANPVGEMQQDGLTKYEVSGGERVALFGGLYDVLYVQSDASEILGFFGCTRINSKRQSCSHWFNDNNLFVKLDYSRTHQSEWRSIQLKTQDLIAQFRQDKN